MNTEIRAAQGRDGLDTEYKFGFNADISNTEETVWDEGGIYVYPGSAAQWKVSSSSTDDDDGGTGALTVRIYGLDANYDLQNEVITLDGQTVVMTVKSYIRVFRGIVLTAGSGGVNAGDIYVGTGTVSSGVPAVKYLKITATMNQTLMALWTVPKDTWFYMTALMASTYGNSSQSLMFRLVARPFGEVFQTKSKFLLFRSPVEWDYRIPLRFKPKTDIEVRAVTSSGTIDGSAAFEGYMMSR